MPKFKHIFGPPGYHQYQVTVLKQPVRSGNSWKTAEEAAVHCDALKWYLKDYGLRFAWSLDGEVFSTLAHRHSVPLTNRLALLASFPERVQEFIGLHRGELEALRESLPSRKPWEVIRQDDLFRDRPDAHKWAHKCELAEMDVAAFEAINQPHFESLVIGASKSISSAINALNFALAVVSRKPGDNDKLDARASGLRVLIVKLEEQRNRIVTLSEDMKRETLEVRAALDKLLMEQPPLFLDNANPV